MKYKLLLSIIATFLVAKSFSQNTTGIIRGIIRDSTAHSVLKRATINVLRADSTSAGQSLSGDDGTFALGNIPYGKYILKISFSGYETRYKDFAIDSTSNNLNAGIVYMSQQAHELETVIVQSAPIIIKKDTVEFNANAFATKPNATAQDLLQKLPGVDVDQTGNIKAQGETVQRVLVNGKRFFGDDPRTATQNLPADMIDKIQVFDDQSDQSTFTGFDDGNRVKTVNIIMKKNAGQFGKIVVGAGDKGLYDVAANYNFFKGDQQISFIGQINNTNKQNFTPQDIFGGSAGGGRSSGFGGGGRGGSGGGGNRGGSQFQQLQSLNANNNNSGIITTSAAGLNYRDQWGKNTSAYGSYFYNNMLTSKDQLSNTQTLIKGGASQNEDQSSAKRSINHRFNFNIESQLDSMNSLVIRPNVAYQQTTNRSSATSSSYRSPSDTVNKIAATADSYNEGYNGNIDMLFRHKFQKKGRTFSIDVNASGNTNNGYGNNLSRTDYFNNGIDSISNINQHYVSTTNGSGLSTTLAYTEPIGRRSQLELDYNNTYNDNNSNRTTYNYDSSTGKFSSVDSLLTNNYNNTYSSNRVTLNYRIQGAQWNLSFGNGVQFGSLTSINDTKNITISQTYTNMYPTANFMYRFSKSSNLRFNYSGRTNQPSVTQLQPIIDNSDPANVVIGNPDLKQSFTHSFRALFTNFKFDGDHSSNMFATINATFTNNSVVSNVAYDTLKAVDTVRYANLNGAYNISAFFNYGFRLNKPKSNLNFTTNFTDSRSVNLINSITNYTQNYTIGETVKFTTNLKQNFDMNFSATPTYNIVQYSTQPDQNQNYFSQNLNVDATYYTKSGWIVNPSFNYTFYTGRSDGYNTSVPLLNAALAKQFLKNKQAEFRFSVFDLLNQNKSIQRNVNENYIQDVQTKVLTRYFLLTFTYNLRTKSQQQQKQLPNFNGRDMPSGPPPGGMPGPPPGGGDAPPPGA